MAAAKKPAPNRPRILDFSIPEDFDREFTEWWYRPENTKKNIGELVLPYLRSLVRGETPGISIPEYLVAQHCTVSFEPHDELGWVWWPDDCETYRFTAHCASCHGVSFTLGTAAAFCPYCGAPVDREKTQHRTCELEMIELLD